MKSGISLSHVSFSYSSSEKIIKDVSLKIKPGTFLGITGVNGSGKSTLLYLLNGLIPHHIKGRLKGRILVDNISTQQKPVSYFATKIGLVFQNPDFSLFNLTVREELEFGLKNLKLNHDQPKLQKALTAVGLSHYLDRDPQTLSLGEKQKLCLASVLVLDTDYIALDEPTAMLDYQSSVEIYKILDSLNQKGKTIIVVEHDTDFLYQYTSQVLILAQGKIKDLGPTKQILSQTSLLNKLGVKPPRA